MNAHLELCINIEDAENQVTSFTNNCEYEKRSDEINGIKVFTYEDESSDNETISASEEETEKEVALIPAESNLNNKQSISADFDEVVIHNADEEDQNKQEPRITWRSLPYWQTHFNNAKQFDARKPINCLECKHHFTYWTFLNHIRFVHHEKLKYCCDVCNQYFINREELSKHRNVHNMKKDTIHPRVYMCSECARAYISVDELLNHIKFSHTFVCNTGCNRWFRSRSARDEHSRAHTTKYQEQLEQNKSNIFRVYSTQHKNKLFSENTKAIIKTFNVAEKTEALGKETIDQNDKIEPKLTDDNLNENLHIFVSDKNILIETSSSIERTINCKSTILAERILSSSLATKEHSKRKASNEELKIDAENSIIFCENTTKLLSESKPAISKTFNVVENTKAVTKESIAQKVEIQPKQTDVDFSEILHISKRKNLKRNSSNLKDNDVFDKKILKESSSSIDPTINCKKTNTSEHISRHSKRKASHKDIKIDAENSLIFCESKSKSPQSTDRLQCTKCFEISKSDKLFQLHLKKHVSPNPHICKVCSKKFLIFNELLEHMETHSKELPFYCQQCYQRFRLKATLLVHMDRHKQPFICEICSKGFKKIERLSEHMLSHL